MFRKSLAVVALMAVSGMVGVAAPVAASPKAQGAQSLASATVTAKISGTPSGALVLAVLPSGASSFAKIRNGAFTIKLPKVADATPSFSLHVVSAKKMYLGPISFGVVASGKTTWYGRMLVKNGATTNLSRITFSKKFGTLTSSQMLCAAPLKNVSAGGKPAGAGRLGMGKRASAKSLNVYSVTAASDSVATDPGGDLDADGLPNSLDIDDNGNGIPDPTDKATGAAGAVPTAQYDAVSSLGIMMGQNQATNYNLFRDITDEKELIRTVSRNTSEALIMGIRAINTYFDKSGGSYIKAARVDCTGLAWCLKSDDNSGEEAVPAPQVTPLRWNTIWSLWQSVYGDKTDAVTWADFTMHGFLQDAYDAGYDAVSISKLKATIDGVPETKGGFGLYDDNVFLPVPKDGDKVPGRGSDLWTFVYPRGGYKLMENLKPGEVFTINAVMSDGVTRSIAMTVAPYFVTAPTITSMKPGGGSEQLVDYTNENILGSQSNQLTLDKAHPTVDLTFWRPQRQLIPGADPTDWTEPLVDMGHLDYEIQIHDDAHGIKAMCPNSTVTWSDSEDGPWNKVTSKGDQGKPEFTNDASNDSPAATSRTATAHIDVSACLGGAGNLYTGGRYMLTLMANGQLGNDSNRNSATQGLYFTFS